MNTTAQVKQAIKKSAQQIASEPLELLKSAAKQVAGSENIPFGEPVAEQPISKPDDVPQDEKDYKKIIADQDGRHLQALESELKDIRRQKIFNDLMQRIQNGEDVPLEEFSELSFEQKEVLKAQLEAMKNRNLQTTNSELIEPASKRGRQMNGGQKRSAQKQTTRVEKPVPPSG